MAWMKQNISVGNIIVILILVGGWVSQYALDNYKMGLFAQEIVKLEGVEVGEINLNTDYRKQGHSFTIEKEQNLHASYLHAISKDTHMPYAEKVKVFVPRTEFDVVKEDIKEIKADIKLILQKLP